MFGKLTSIVVVAASLCAAQLAPAATAEPLPVVFFHGVTGDHTNAAVIEANLTGGGRAYVALDFCEKACSVKTSLVEQIQMAIKQIRGIVSSDARYANGYHFMGHSTGASIARGVIEEMDDHKVHSLISLAGDGNGGFWGPQVSDQAGLQVLLQLLGPYAISVNDFNFTKYAADPSTWNGKVQRDLAEFASTRPDLQRSNSIVQNVRVPVAGPNAGWITNGTFYPQVNNLDICNGNLSCALNQKRRKRNFLKLQAAHFFASPQDDLQTPWQTSLLGRYSEVSSIDEVETKFAELTIVDMEHTREYQQDLYGLKTLDKAGRLHLHSVPNVGHDCWLFDYTPLNSNVTCLHDPVYAANIYPLLV